MAKDPAINWYFDNWAGGTKTMNRFLKGCYMDLLDAQFHNGHLTLDEIKHVLGGDFSAWQSLRKKFIQDIHGNYFNERLDQEMEKRKKFFESKIINGKKGGRPPNKITEIKPIGFQQVKLPETENETESWTQVVKNFFNDFNWIEKFCRDKNIGQKFLESRMRYFINDIELREDFKDLREIKNHFTNWFNKEEKSGKLQPVLNGAPRLKNPNV